MPCTRPAYATGFTDTIFPAARTWCSPRDACAVFVHGCFWHGCPRCRHGARDVKSNAAYWSGKLARNKARDVRHSAVLEAAGWTVLTIWECETVHPGSLVDLAAAIRAAPPKA